MFSILLQFINVFAQNSLYQNYGPMGNALSNPDVQSSLNSEDSNNWLLGAMTGPMFDGTTETHSAALSEKTEGKSGSKGGKSKTTKKKEEDSNDDDSEEKSTKKGKSSKLAKKPESEEDSDE